MDTAISLPEPHMAGQVALYFTKPWTPSLFARVVDWALGRLIGLPTHVTPAICGQAFVLAPGDTGCFQVDERAYRLTLEIHSGIYDIVTVTVPDIKGALDAAYTYGVGPVTSLQTIRRYMTGHEHRDDVDCVLAAVKILRGGGLDIPTFRTPKGLLLWLKARPLVCLS